jgi:hypothetical protein
VGVFTALAPPACEPYYNPSTPTLNPSSPLPHSILSHFEPQNINTSIFFMSSSAQASSSSSDIQSIIEAALADYTKITGTDLTETPFAAALEQSNSPEAILRLLLEREKGFKEYRDGNRRLINCLTPAVTVLQAFSGILSAVSQVSHTCHPVTPTLLTVASSDPFSTSKRVVCRYRYSPCCTSLQYLFNRSPCDE